MKSVCVIVLSVVISCAFVVPESSAGQFKQWSRVSVADDGSVLSVSKCGSYKKGALGPNEYPDGYQFPPTIAGETGADAYKYWKKSGNDWVEMTQAEKDLEDDLLKTENGDFDNYDDSLQTVVRLLMDEFSLNEKQMKAKLKDKAKAKKEKSGKNDK